MKKLFTLMMLASCTLVSAQKTCKVFCELLGHEKLLSNKVTVTVDFGQETSFWRGASDQYLVDDKGKAIKFNSMVDAMNYMGRRGWVFEQAYVVTISNQNVYHWLLSKEIAADGTVSEDFDTKHEFKKQQEAESEQEEKAEQEIKVKKSKKKRSREIGDDVYF